MIFSLVVFAKKKGMFYYPFKHSNVLVTKIVLFNSYFQKNRLNLVSNFLSNNSKHLSKSLVGNFSKENQYCFNNGSKVFITNKDFIFKFYNCCVLKDFVYRKKINFNILDHMDSFTITGVSSGKGFAGTIKRHSFKRGPMSHGSKSHRLPGSIGASTTPGRVFKNKKMAGHLGTKHVTLKKNVLIKKINNVLFIKGSLPGKENSLLKLKFNFN